jgi:hypothetical protein
MSRRAIGGAGTTPSGVYRLGDEAPVLEVGAYVAPGAIVAGKVSLHSAGLCCPDSNVEQRRKMKLPALTDAP